MSYLNRELLAGERVLTPCCSFKCVSSSPYGSLTMWSYHDVLQRSKTKDGFGGRADGQVINSQSKGSGLVPSQRFKAHISQDSAPKWRVSEINVSHFQNLKSKTENEIFRWSWIDEKVRNSSWLGEEQSCLATEPSTHFNLPSVSLPANQTPQNSVVSLMDCERAKAKVVIGQGLAEQG